jgi:hypothetical protein
MYYYLFHLIEAKKKEGKYRHCGNNFDVDLEKKKRKNF